MRLLFVLFLVGYLALMPILKKSLAERPLSVKADYMPAAHVVRASTGEFSTLVASYTVLRTLFYFGQLFDLNQRNITKRPEYAQIYYNLVQALKLDPYNEDIYYFAQATFTWDVGRIRETNRLLEYGLKYRAQDWHLPFWIGFNNAYFLKDFEQAAKYFRMAAEITGDNLFTRLAARYYYESGREELGISFLETMLNSARDEQVRRVYQLRHDALVAARELRLAVEKYRKIKHILPDNLNDLVVSGFLAQIPDDPYGGSFYLDSNGQIRSSSKFSLDLESSFEEKVREFNAPDVLQEF